ncbi:uncharacterized protein METZ01_LOCUS204587, partial [marine metagenome]
VASPPTTALRESGTALRICYAVNDSGAHSLTRRIPRGFGQDLGI